MTATLSSFDMILARNGLHGINHNVDKNEHDHNTKHPHHSVRFLPDLPIMKANKFKSPAVALSEELVISESSYDVYATMNTSGYDNIEHVTVTQKNLKEKSISVENLKIMTFQIIAEHFPSLLITFRDYPHISLFHIAVFSLFTRVFCTIFIH